VVGDWDEKKLGCSIEAKSSGIKLSEHTYWEDSWSYQGHVPKWAQPPCLDHIFHIQLQQCSQRKIWGYSCIIFGPWDSPSNRTCYEFRKWWIQKCQNGVLHQSGSGVSQRVTKLAEK